MAAFPGSPLTPQLIADKLVAAANLLTLGKTAATIKRWHLLVPIV